MENYQGKLENEVFNPPLVTPTWTEILILLQQFQLVDQERTTINFNHLFRDLSGDRSYSGSQSSRQYNALHFTAFFSNQLLCPERNINAYSPGPVIVSANRVDIRLLLLQLEEVTAPRQGATPIAQLPPAYAKLLADDDGPGCFFPRDRN